MKKILILLIFISITGCNFSEGSRVGTVTKFSKKGILFKTWEGELSTYAKGKAATAMINTFEFTVKDSNIINEIQQAMNNGIDVTLYYEEKFIIFPWEGDTKYFITKVHKHKKDKE